MAVPLAAAAASAAKGLAGKIGLSGARAKGLMKAAKVGSAARSASKEGTEEQKKHRPLLWALVGLVFFPMVILSVVFGGGAGVAIAQAESSGAAVENWHGDHGIATAASAFNAGLRGDQLIVAVAISRAESGWDYTAMHQNGNGSIDFGLWQINNRAQSQYARGCASTDAASDNTCQLLEPNYNAQAMAQISRNGRAWTAWCTTYASGPCAGAYEGGMGVNAPCHATATFHSFGCYIGDAKKAVAGIQFWFGGAAAGVVPWSGSIPAGLYTCCMTRQPVNPAFTYVPPGGFQPNGYPIGQCTYWARYNSWFAGQNPETNAGLYESLGDGGSWVASAAAAGLKVLSPAYLPPTGSTVSWKGGPFYDAAFGHVAVVVADDPDGRGYWVSEMNFQYPALTYGGNNVDTRHVAFPDPYLQGSIVGQFSGGPGVQSTSARANSGRTPQ